MALNITSVFDILDALNYTANCTIALEWRSLYSSPAEPNYGFVDDSTNAAFIHMAWPVAYQSTDDNQIDEFYDSISFSNLGIG